MDINLMLALFAGALLVFAAFSTVLQRASLPGPLLCLAFGALVGPHALGLLRMEDFGVPEGTLLEQAARITLAVGLAGVALRLPHGYWRNNARWIAVIIGAGMALMLVVATGVLWWGLGVAFLVALLVGAIITPTDPVVTTPIVTGSMAEEKVTERVRHNLSAESGITATTPRVEPGSRVRLRQGWHLLRISFACQVVYVVKEDSRQGFAYVTLQGHPERGEERFRVEWREDDAVVFTLTAFSRPGTWWSRAVAPISRRLQQRYTHRYLQVL